VTGFILGNIINLIFTLLSFLVSLIIMFTLNFRMALMICSIFPVYIFIYLRFKQPLYDLGYELTETSNKYYSKINKQITNIRLIKQNSWNERVSDEMKSGFASVYKIIMKNARLSYVFNNADALVKYMANMIIFIYSGFLIMSKNMSIGQFTMINSYSLIVISSLSAFLGFGKSYRNSLVAYDRIQEILNTKQENNGTLCISDISQIVVRNLSFHYGNRQIISDLNAEFNKGYIYAIVGENASGKSTFLNILSGMIQNFNGEVYYNSYNLHDINIYHLREKCLTIVEQEPILYFERLVDNISFDKKKGKEIDYWVRRLDLYELISSLPGKLDYIISEKSMNLSGGEKQRIAEVGAFVSGADVLVFDEPSSALDKGSLKLLCEIINEIKKNKIIIIVTHNQSLIEISDKIIHFDNVL